VTTIRTQAEWQPLEHWQSDNH